MLDPSPHPHANLEGRLVLATPSLRDGIFDKSVILVADHSETDGAFGLILNHPAGQRVGDLLKDDAFSALANVQVHIGGPVSRGHMTFAAFWEDEDRFRYATRISAEQAVDHVHQPGTLVRAFVGYTGWSKDQLEDEIDQESWVVTGVPDIILGETHDRALWGTILKELSPFYRILASAPDNILAN
ncbi:YqgE/AlgH family protein [Akkermansiaceae bacterium]|nr:YqgE/AlgH family protein [Akkermansiaceae bacterium]MDB4716034.1 YqgE/AlgH family protein [bacterium]MDA7517763.1 YqgE/AlgH family protein [Akkermansiaceae bacterium]MDA7538356.1 YqgE/AlgH family protein [Akkermansiaceae bacterium]MDA7931922.1 YqgE/AlgH family protein [Akkermansiaceae bacterium]